MIGSFHEPRQRLFDAFPEQDDVLGGETSGPGTRLLEQLFERHVPADIMALGQKILAFRIADRVFRDPLQIRPQNLWGTQDLFAEMPLEDRRERILQEVIRVEQTTQRRLKQPADHRQQRLATAVEQRLRRLLGPGLCLANQVPQTRLDGWINGAQRRGHGDSLEERKCRYAMTLAQ
jgi:hypothetical protein